MFFAFATMIFFPSRLKNIFFNFWLFYSQVSLKLNPADPSKSLSMGFGFVQFYARADAQEALKNMQVEKWSLGYAKLEMIHDPGF